MGERSEQRRIEKTAGTGSISHAGNVMGAVAYLLEIWQTFHILSGLGPAPDEEVPGLMELRIHFLRHGLDALKLPEQAATLTLQLGTAAGSRDSSTATGSSPAVN